jgi:drug/metabolite transporter (DMT)-like permease
VTNMVASLALGEVQYMPALSLAWLYLGIYAVVSLLGFWFAIEGYKNTEAGVGGLLGLLEVIFAVIFGIVLFNQPLSLQVALGAILILLAAALPHFVSLRKSDYYAKLD